MRASKARSSFVSPILVSMLFPESCKAYIDRSFVMSYTHKLVILITLSLTELHLEPNVTALQQPSEVSNSLIGSQPTVRRTSIDRIKEAHHKPFLITRHVHLKATFRVQVQVSASVFPYLTPIEV